MRLPNCEQAIVAREKITGYLLAVDHVDGGSKAAFFLRFGFVTDAWVVFATALRDHACANDVASVRTAVHGDVYRVEGPLDTPDGRRPFVRSVWIVGHDSDTPSLVTAYPIGRKSV